MILMEVKQVVDAFEMQHRMMLAFEQCEMYCASVMMKVHVPRT